MKPLITLDFETEAIDGALPPRPVGVALRADWGSKYLRWGHPTENNCTEEGAKNIVKDCKDRYSFVMHNAAFDIGVMKHHWGFAPSDFEDTLLMLFLVNPHGELSLKPASEKLLGWPAEEQDRLHQWILANVKGATKKNAGAYICKAPGNLVAKYAIGDVDRTWALYERLKDKVVSAPYNREKQLLPILLENTLNGVRVDIERLGWDVAYYTDVIDDVDSKIFRYLKSDGFNINSGEELADAIERSGMHVNWVLTPTGKRSTSKENLELAITDAWLKPVLDYRAKLKTFLGTFMEPWFHKASGDRIHLSWNQVRNYERGKDATGTRSGRLSSVPSFLNIPNIFHHPEGLPPLPVVRSYIIPEEGQKILKRDYSQQELRILAHYEDGPMMQMYKDNPRIDAHDFGQQRMSEILRREIKRKQTKNCAFAIIYGSGLATLAETMGGTINEAKELKAAYYETFPGIKNVQASIKKRWNAGKPIYTIGGRPYHKEWHPTRDLTYKGTNYLIQPSAADITKQSIINYHEIRRDGTWYMAVHDENVISGPLSEMALLREAMDGAMSDVLDVPLVSDGSIGDNYGELSDYE